MTILEFPNRGRAPADEAMAFAMGVASEIVSQVAMQAPLGFVYRDGANVAEFWLSVSDAGLAGLWAHYDDDSDRLISQFQISVAANDESQIALRRFLNCANAFSKAALARAGYCDAENIEIRFAPKSEVIEVRRNGLAVGYWSAQQ